MTQDLNCARRAAVHQPQTTDAFCLSESLGGNILDEDKKTTQESGIKFAEFIIVGGPCEQTCLNISEAVSVEKPMRLSGQR